MKKQLITSLLLLVSIGLFAQSKQLKDIQKTQELSLEVTDLFSKNKIDRAVKAMAPYSIMPEEEMNAFQQKTTASMSTAEQRYGKFIGTVKVSNKTILDFALRETHFIRFERGALRLVFTYYRNEKGWILNRFEWDDSMEQEF